MERRNWSVKALTELTYIDSLDQDAKVVSLRSWLDLYLSENKIEDFDLELHDLKKLSELFYRNINSLKKTKDGMREQLQNQNKIREFLK